ncbi:hypothetical protein V2J09_017281 [Rumex salicifolius]
MSLTKIVSRASRRALVHCKGSSFTYSSATISVRHFSNRFNSLSSGPLNEAPALRRMLNTSTFQWFGMSTSASPESNEKKEEGANVENKEDNDADTKKEGAAAEDAADQKEESDSEGELDDLSREDLVKLANESKILLETKQKEITAMQDKVLRSYAEMENVMDRARREAENSKKFAIQSFAKGLLDVADNLNRASSIVKESFAKIDVSQDASGATPLLKTLLEGVEMTEKQLLDVFRKFGVEKDDPANEQFDPNRHNAVFQVPDDSKPAGTIAVVLKPGYTLHDRIIRPAEVGVTKAVEDGEAN